MEEKSGARRAPYSGTLEARPLAALLAHASMQRKQTVVSLVCDERRVEIASDGGRIVRASAELHGLFAWPGGTKLILRDGIDVDAADGDGDGERAAPIDRGR